MPQEPSPARFYPWATRTRRDAGSRETLTRDQIVDAAMRILDEEGLAALSMRRLGRELDAGATSVYWHVRNKDELLDLVVDRVLGEVLDELERDGRPEGWQAWMEAVAVSMRRVLLRHRGVAPVVGERPTFGPNALAALEGLLAALRDAGFAPVDALLASTTLVTWASGFAVFEVRDPLGPHATAAEREAYLAELGAALASLPPDRFPATVALAPAGAAITADMQFRYALEALLDGIEARRRRSADA